MIYILNINSVSTASAVVTQCNEYTSCLSKPLAGLGVVSTASFQKRIFLLCNEVHASPRFPVLGPLPFSHQILCQYGVHFAKKNGQIGKKMDISAM